MRRVHVMKAEEAVQLSAEWARPRSGIKHRRIDAGVCVCVYACVGFTAHGCPSQVKAEIWLHNGFC